VDTEQTSSGPSVESAPNPEVEKLAAEKAELQDRVLRTQAEFQNYRRRIEKEKIELLEYASTEAVRALLPVLDDFERALRTETADKEYVKGIELIYQRLFEGLKKLGLEPIVAEGKPFDPHVHEAVDRVEVDDVSTETVLSELQRGYNFKNRLLRPAMVRVGVPSAR
jgi:molecular chaperone GrpE